MFFRLLLLFTLVPLLELYLLLAIGRVVGFLPTVALVLITGVVGAWLAKSQGLRAWARVRAEMAAGRPPAAALLDGVLILIAGAVLLTPGLLTDLCGFFLLTPWGRGLVRRALSARIGRLLSQRRGEEGQVIIIEQQPPP